TGKDHRRGLEPGRQPGGIEPRLPYGEDLGPSNPSWLFHQIGADGLFQASLCRRRPSAFARPQDASTTRPGALARRTLGPENTATRPRVHDTAHVGTLGC